MEQARKNHWYWHTKGNSLLITLPNFQVRIKVVKIIDNMTHYQLYISSNQREEKLVLYFRSLEESMLFTENVILHATTIQEILNAQQEQYQKENFQKQKKVVRS